MALGMILSDAAYIATTLPSCSAFIVNVKQTHSRVYNSVDTSTSSQLRDMNGDTTDGAAAPGTDTTVFPDYGSTSVDVDGHKLEKKRRSTIGTTTTTTKKKTAEQDVLLPSVSERWIREDLFGESLVGDTLRSLETDTEFQRTSERLDTLGPAAVSREERTLRRRALEDLGVPDWLTLVAQHKAARLGAPQLPLPLRRRTPTLLQVNIGLYCNQACAHCHVESSPLKTEEQMETDTVVRILYLLQRTPSITTLDITGGAPELNQNFRMLVSMARELRGDALEIIDRCNLTVLQEPHQEDLVDFLASHRVRVVASLPCYSETNVDTQRGTGVFDRSISALLAFNKAGYGITTTSTNDNNNNNNADLKLDLVYNPLGAFLPPEEKALEAKYKEELLENFGIRFNELFTMTNMPVKRFADFLYRRGELKEYMDLLVRNFNLETTDSLMCLNTISVGWDGRVFDCDFNQQLGYGIGTDEIHGAGGKTVFDVDTYADLMTDDIKNDNHCFGCTAGMGSS